MKKIKVKKNTENLFCKIISFLLVASSISFLGLLFYIDLLPIKYSITFLLIILIFDALNIFLINLKRLKKKIKKIISITMVIATLIFTIANFYIGKTLGVLLNNGDSKYKLEHYSVIVLKDSDYNKVKDIKGEKIGYFKNSTGANDANNRLKKEVNVDFEAYKASDSLAQNLLDEEINVIVVEDSIKNIMEEEIDDFEDLTKTIYSFKIRTKVETTLKQVDVTKEPFAIYISGIDTYGEISSVSRSDVNMVMVVNPKIRQVLLISIPRDYYVQLHGTTGTKDKITHAGIYGIDMSIQTIEDLLELDINYYLKVNFTSVIDIVDALGGLDVYSEYTFTSYSGYKFKKGLNYVNGKQALDFARTRKAFKDGDRQRGKNQQAVIEAIIRKITNKSIITKYNSLLNAIDGKYQTNISMKSITSLVKMQLKDMSSWNITSHSLTGKDSKDYTYTYNQLLYVMKPDTASIDEAIELINNVLNGEQLENSYTNLEGSSNKVTKVQTNTKKETNTKNDKKEEIIDPSIKKDDTIEKEDVLKKENEIDIEEQDKDTDDSSTSNDSNIEQIEKEPSLEENNNNTDLPSESDEDSNLSDENTTTTPIAPIIPTPEN
ncbi:MAG: LCP family protein [Bacilli bacterium]|nr:LCP family protein [Bacilli bacterium]